MPGHGYLPVDTYLGQPDYDRYHKTDWAAGYAFRHQFGDIWSVTQNLRYERTRLDYHVVVTPFGTAPPTVMRAARIVRETLGTLAIDTRAQAMFGTGAVHHDLLIGLDYQRSNDDYANGTALAPTLDIYDPDYHQVITDPAIRTHSRQYLDQTGVYVQEQARLAGLVLTLSGRHDWVDSAIRNRLTGTRTSSGTARYSGRAGLNYVFDGGFAPYVSYSQSFQPVIGVNSSTGEGYRPTTGQQLEGGIKYQPGGGHLLLTAAAYRLVQDDVVTADPLTTETSQTGRVRVRGVELEANATPLPGLSLIATYTYADSRVTRSSDPDEIGNRLPIAVVSGVILYGPFMRRTDFGTIRADRSPRLKWLDLHNLVGIATLAWALVVGATGVLNTGTDLIRTHWQTHDLAALFAGAPASPSGTATISADRALAIARRASPGLAPMAILFPGASRSTDAAHYGVFLRGTAQATQRLFRPVYIDARSGAVRAVVDPPWYLAALLVSRPLHYGDYGGLPMKIIWALLDLATIIVLMSGLILWTDKRRPA